MNDNVIEWAKSLNSLSVEEIMTNTSPDGKYHPPDSFHTHVGFVVVHLSGHAFITRHDFDLMTLHISEDDALFDLVDTTNFEEYIRLMNL